MFCLQQVASSCFWLDFIDIKSFRIVKCARKRSNDKKGPPNISDLCGFSIIEIESQEWIMAWMCYYVHFGAQPKGSKRNAFTKIDYKAKSDKIDYNSNFNISESKHSSGQNYFIELNVLFEIFFPLRSTLCIKWQIQMDSWAAAETKLLSLTRVIAAEHFESPICKANR